MSTSENGNMSAYKFCLGSINSRNRFGWVSLIAQMVTTSSVALELLDREVIDLFQREEIANGLGVQDEHTARAVAAFLAGVRRIGEAYPGHMVTFDPASPPSPELRRACAAWREQASYAGLPKPGFRPDRMCTADITAAVLPRLIGCDCAGYTDGERCRAPAHRGLYLVAYAIAASGADALHADNVAKACRATGDADWDAVRAGLVASVAAHVGIDAHSLPELIRPTSLTDLTAFSGLVSLSERYSRESRFYDLVSPYDMDETLSNRARLHAREVVDRLRGTD